MAKCLKLCNLCEGENREGERWNKYASNESCRAEVTPKD